jgi:hypothetical protein
MQTRFFVQFFGSATTIQRYSIKMDDHDRAARLTDRPPPFTIRVRPKSAARQTMTSCAEGELQKGIARLKVVNKPIIVLLILWRLPAIYLLAHPGIWLTWFSSQEFSFHGMVHEA